MLNSPLIVALDFDQEHEVMALVSQLSPQDCRLKVGKQLFTACGPAIIKKLHSFGFEVFLDLKFHDIPNTVAQAVKAACELGVWMVNVHASGGRAMLAAARAAVDSFSGAKPYLIAVTVLTSMETTDFTDVGVAGEVMDQVKRLAGLASSCGLDGVVCSAQEALVLRQQLGDQFLLVTPGIRINASCQDQKRVMTPQAALANGAHYLVMGRSITQTPNPEQVVTSLKRDIFMNNEN